jgi:subtilisin family serine protease
MERFPYRLVHGSGDSMSLDRSRLLIAFNKEHSREEAANLVRDLGFVLEDAFDKDTKRLPDGEKVNHTTRRFWVRLLQGEAISQEQFSNLEEALGQQLDWIGPVYRLAKTEGRGGLLCPLPNILLINPKNVSPEELSKIFSKYGLKENSEKSKYLSGYRYLIISDTKKYLSYDVQRLLQEEEGKQFVLEARFENMPMMTDLTLIPNDTLFAQQWNMTKIEAAGAGTTGWDISTGVGTVIICILDYGCDLTHPDITYSTRGINLSTMMPDGSPTVAGDASNHGTSCAGITAARFNNMLGVAGLAGSCQIMPLARVNGTDAEVAAGINFAADNGARVISMSFGRYAAGEGFNPIGWDFTIIDPAIAHAVNDRSCVLCAATGNENTGTVNRYPARHPLVIACGASDQSDNRRSPASPDGDTTWLGSNFGTNNYLGQNTGVSVVAPGVLIPTTDRQGANGYNTTAGTAGDYYLTFSGTSSATPHVAGLAALLFSQYPALTNIQIRNIIERTAAKVGTVAYADAAGFPNGTRNQQMGYGRIDVLHALDFADVMIKDWPGDTGIEPSTPPVGDFWDFSDIVMRITDDNLFVPDDPTQSSYVQRGQTNYLYIRVTNNGPRNARNVFVNSRITPYVGLEFVYPNDWTAMDATHVAPTPITNTFASVPSGGSVIAKFSISSAQVEDLWGWQNSHPWHPCLLAEVNADNDYAFATSALTGTAGLQVRRNNLAQRNLSVINVPSDTSIAFPFIAGSRFNEEKIMTLIVERPRLPKNMKLLLLLDDQTNAFPRVDITPIPRTQNMENGIVFLERTKIEATIGYYKGTLTLEKGSKFEYPTSTLKLGRVNVKSGGEVIMRDEKRFVEIREDTAVISIEKQPGQMYPFSLYTTIPPNSKKDQQFRIDVSQRNQEKVVGGASVVYIIK